MTVYECWIVRKSIGLKQQYFVGRDFSDNIQDAVILYKSVADFIANEMEGNKSLTQYEEKYESVKLSVNG